MNVPTTVINSPEKCSLGKSKEPIPFGGAQRLAAVGEFSISGGISGLLDLRNPAAVFFGVITVWINSIYRVIRRGLVAHVSKERDKTSVAVPLSAHLNSASTIGLVVVAFWVVAAGADVNPSTVFGTPSPEVSVPMFSWSPLALPVVATTGLRVAGSDLCSLDDLAGSAVAATEPHNPSSVIVRAPSHRKATEFFPSYILSDFLGFHVSKTYCGA